METLKRNVTPIRMRNYGRIIQEMIDVALSEPNEQMRQRMTIYIARCMRYKNYTWNKDQDASVARVRNDIRILSNGQLSCDFPDFEPEFGRAFYSNQPMRGGKRKDR